jgi:hypothetical protein
MRARLFPLAALLALTVAWPAAAEDKKADKPSKPTVVVRLAPIDSLIADARYLAELIGKANEAEQGEAFLKGLADDKGLLGLDTKRPMGLYGYLTPGGIDSPVVVLLPVADEKALLEKIESFGPKPEKEEGDVWKLEVDRVPFPIYLKFANKYVYVSPRDRDVLDKGRLLDPAKVLAGSGTASVVINFDEIPRKLKEMVLGQTELQLSIAKDKEMPGETKSQKELRLATLDEMYFRFKQLLTEGGPLALHLNLDRKAGDLTLEASLAGKPDSKLAASIAELGKLTGVAAGVLGKGDAALRGNADLVLPKKLREAMAAVFEEGFKQGLEKEQDETKRKVAESLIKVMGPTVAMGELDAGLVLRGPDSSGLYTLVGAGKVKDGKSLEQTLKDALKESPAKVRGALTTDFAKAGDVNIHKAVPDKVDDNTRNTLGDGPVYFAFRDDALIVTAGPGALEAIKEAATAAPAPTRIVQLEVAFSKFAKMMASEDKEAPAVAKAVFKGGDDTLRLTLEGGASLKLGLGVKARLVKFFNELEEAKKTK